MSLRTLLGLGILAAMALSGCGGTETPPPPPPTEPTTTSSGTPAPSVPPPVDNPVDLTPYARHPCPALTQQQVAELGFPSAEGEEMTRNEGGAELMQCWWSEDTKPPEPPSTHGLYVFTVYPTGDPLAKAYQDYHSRQGEKDNVWRFEEHAIRGLPAMARFTGEGEYGCEVIVGAGNGQGFTIWVGATAVPDEGMCSRLIDAAELIVDAVKG